MKKLLLLITGVSFGFICNATLHINIYSSPVTISHIYQSSIAASYFMAIQGDTDGIEYTIVVNGEGTDYCSAWDEGGGYTFAYDSNWDAIAYSCGDSVSTHSLWEQPITLAQNVGDANFQGKGILYLAFRIPMSNGYIYGWSKIQCSEDGETLTIYGYGYNDEVDTVPTIVAGEGDCISGLTQVAINVGTGLPVSVYPNPFINSFQLKTLSLDNESLQIRIYDILGRLLESKYDVRGNNNISFGTNLANGMYLIVVKQGGEEKALRVVKTQ